VDTCNHQVHIWSTTFTSAWQARHLYLALDKHLSKSSATFGVEGIGTVQNPQNSAALGHK